MKLASEPFNKIASGEKVVESRLYDEKCKLINIGDQIIFSENDRPENNVTTVVTGLSLYPTFKELFADNDPALFSETSREFLLNQIKQFYSDEDEAKYGVVGIQIGLVKPTATP